MLKPKEPQEIVSFFVPFGGENTNDVAERVAKTLTEVMEQEDHTNGFAQWGTTF
jgi:broad specificity phosphatase PhoE